eukprot:Gb_18262 [translate_table: standard]
MESCVIYAVAAVLIRLIYFPALIIRKKSPCLRNLKGKHVLVTGGSTGIGFAIAKEALLQGAFVTVIARNPSRLDRAVENLVKEVKVNRDRICTKIADVGNYEMISMAIKQSFQWRAIDVLVCNAGVSRNAHLDEALIQDLHAMIDTNFTGIINTLHVALPLMKQRSAQSSSVVLIGSLAGLWMSYGNAVYTATKYALKGLAEDLRLELMPYNISMSLVCPGFVETPLLDDSAIEENKVILQMLKVTALYNRSKAESAEKVAKYTLEAAKQGTFLVTYHFSGLVLSTLTRGVMPAETIGRALIELILYVPVRLFTFMAAFYFQIAAPYYHKKFM